jgi:hypothetical protein
MMNPDTKKNLVKPLVGVFLPMAIACGIMLSTKHYEMKDMPSRPAIINRVDKLDNLLLEYNNLQGHGLSYDFKSEVTPVAKQWATERDNIEHSDDYKNATAAYDKALEEHRQRHSELPLWIAAGLIAGSGVYGFRVFK